MEKKRKMPKVVMAVSVAAMGMGLFGALQNEARATGGGSGSKRCVVDVDTGGANIDCKKSGSLCNYDSNCII